MKTVYFLHTLSAASFSTCAISPLMTIPLFSISLGRNHIGYSLQMYRAFGKLRVRFQKGSWINIGVRRPNAQLQEKYFFIFMFQTITGNLFILFLILFPLKEISVSPDPGKASPPQWEHRGIHVCGNSSTFSMAFYHLTYRLHRIPGFICAAVRTLKKAVISLDFRYFFLWIEFYKLGILIGGDDKKNLFPSEGCPDLCRAPGFQLSEWYGDKVAR